MLLVLHYQFFKDREADKTARTFKQPTVTVFYHDSQIKEFS